jgi:hypothetical protein
MYGGAIMSLQPQTWYLVPEETARVARAAFPKGNPYLRMYEELGVIYTDQQFAALFPQRGQPATSPVRLALATMSSPLPRQTGSRAGFLDHGLISMAPAWTTIACPRPTVHEPR